MHSSYFSINTWFIFLGLAALINMISTAALACYISVALNEARGRPRFIIADIIEGNSVRGSNFQQDMPIPTKLNAYTNSLTVSFLDKH